MTTRSLEVTRQIRERILDGRYAGGARMNEIDLAEALGVSRTPIRGALATLAAEGLLDYTPNSGYIVRTYTVDDLVNIYAVRASLVGLAARLAAERGLSDAQRGALHRVLSDSAALVENTPWSAESFRRWAPLDQEFHEIIHAAAGNPFLTDMVRRVATLPLIDHLRSECFDGAVLLHNHEEHVEIADAIVNRQPGRAESLSAEHLYRVGRRLVRHWRMVGGRGTASRPGASDDGEASSNVA